MAETSTLFSGASELLKYGPLGLAGLLLVLVIVALLSKNIDEPRGRLLKLFLYVGAFCFFIANLFAFLPQYISASHTLYLRIEPTDMGQTRKLPAPIVWINSAQIHYPFKYQVASEVTAIIDVSDAINFVDAYRAQDTTQRQVLSDVAAMANASIAKLDQLHNLETGNICYGGAHGVQSPDAGKMVQLSSAVRSGLASALATIEPLVQQAPPDADKFNKAESIHR